MKPLNYEKDVTIDPDALDVEWLRQPELYMRYSQEAAKTRDTLGYWKERSEILAAKLANEVRLNPESFEVAKVTSDSVKEAVGFALDPELTKGWKLTNDARLFLKQYREAMDNYRAAQLDMDTMQAVVRALDHKKNALENLVRLHLGSYFAGPSAPRDLAGELQKSMQERQDERVQEKMSQRKAMTQDNQVTSPKEEGEKPPKGKLPPPPPPLPKKGAA